MYEQDAQQDNPVDLFAKSLEDDRLRLQKRETELQQSLQQRTNPFFNPTLMKISQALLSPTKSGSFGESLGMGVQALMEGSEQEELRRRNMLKMQEELEQKRADVRQGLLRNAMIKKTYESNPQLGQALAAFPGAAEHILPAIFKPSETSRILSAEEKRNRGLPENAPYQMDAKGEIHLISTPDVPKVSPEFRTTMIALGINPDNFQSLTKEQAQVLERYRNAATADQRAAAQRDAAKLFYETGTRGDVPQEKTDFFNTVPPATADAVTGISKKPVAPVSKTAPTVPEETIGEPVKTAANQVPIIEQVTPKQKSELLLDKPNQISTVITVNSTLNQVEQSVDKLLKNESGLRAIVGVSGMIPNIPGRPPAIAATDLQTLKSKVAVQAIQAMRDASKTGGAVGSVTEREWPRLEAQFGNLQQAQDYESIKQALENIKEIINGTRQNIVSRYEYTYGKDDSVSSILKRSSKPEFTVPGARDAFDKYKPRNQ